MTGTNYDARFYNREIAFCKVYSLESKQRLEKLFLKHRISYYVEWQEKSFFQRWFSKFNNKEKNVFIIRINEADSQIARELVKGIESINLKKEKAEAD